MGFGKKVAKAAGKKAIEKAKKSTKHYCAESPNEKHVYIHHKDEEHKGHGSPAVHFYCRYCGRIK